MGEWGAGYHKKGASEKIVKGTPPRRRGAPGGKNLTIAVISPLEYLEAD